MCEHHGPIRNNDTEMVVLAFRDNKIKMIEELSQVVDNAYPEMTMTIYI